MILIHRLVVISMAESMAFGFVTEGDVRELIPAFNRQVDAVEAPAGFGTGRIWRVGPGEKFHKLSEVVSKLHDGDIVEIYGGRYACDTGVKWRANFITVIGVKGRPIIDATNCQISGDKGAWNPQGNGLIIANLEFTGAAGSSRNGAGIRYDGTGYLYITRCCFHDNQNGVLVTSVDGANTNVVIDRCEFTRNGAGDRRSHNIYVSSANAHQVNSFVIRFSYSGEPLGGHAVKTRALSNYVLYNRLIGESNSSSNSVVDISQGGLSYVIGNVIEHGVDSNSTAMVSYSRETPQNAIQELYLINNTMLGQGADAVALLLADNACARVVDNLMVGISPSNLVNSFSSKVSLANNVITSKPSFIDSANRDYRLAASSPAVSAGVGAGSAHDFALTPIYELDASGRISRRRTIAPFDAGAYAYQPISSNKEER